jgi:hypothetical protein
MTTIPDGVARSLVQHLSRTAAALDHALAGIPPEPQQARGVDYNARAEASEQAARHELAELKKKLAGLSV